MGLRGQPRSDPCVQYIRTFSLLNIMIIEHIRSELVDGRCKGIRVAPLPRHDSPQGVVVRRSLMSCRSTPLGGLLVACLKPVCSRGVVSTRRADGLAPLRQSLSLRLEVRPSRREERRTQQAMVVGAVECRRSPQREDRLERRSTAASSWVITK